MLRHLLIETYKWLRDDMMDSCCVVYSYLDNTGEVIDAVLRDICQHVDNFAKAII